MNRLSLEPNESIITEVRKHWFTFLIEGLGAFMAAILPLIGLLAALVTTDNNLSAKAFYLIGFLYLAWLIIVWIYFFLSWTDYYLDVWIITNQKIIDVEQRGVFNREVSSFRLDHIQDITIEVPGFLPTMLDYGHLHVQTAGERREFIIYHAAEPQKVKDLILKEYRREFLSSRRPDEPSD